MTTPEDLQRWYGQPEPGVLAGGISEDGRDIILQATGDDTQLKEIADSLRHLTALPKQFKTKHHGLLHVPLTWALVTQMAKIAEQKGYRWKPADDLNEWIVAEFTRRFAEYKDTSDLKFDVSSLDRSPMPHQLAGAFVGAVNQRMFLADAAGTGKTMTLLLALAEMEARGLSPFPALVITPASVVDPWLEELEACFPQWTYTAYRGPKRAKLSARYQVYVCSWDTFRADMFPRDKAECPHGHGKIDWKSRDQKELDKHLMGQVSTPMVCVSCNAVMLPVETEKTELPPLLEFVVPRTVIMDEAHALVNVTTRQSIAANRIARVVPYVLLASGTPITRDVAGFWRAISTLDVRSFPDQERYKERYTDRYRKDYGQQEVEGLSTANRDEFFTLLQGSLRRVSKQEVLKDLPDKTYQTRVVTLPPAYRRAYDEMQEDMLAHMPDGDVLPVMSTLAQLTRLTQLASSACDVDIEMRLDEKEDSLTFGEEIPHYTVTAREPSWKIDALMEILEESDGEPIITTSPHAQLVKLAGARAEKHGYRVGYIVGGQSAAARTKTRIAFQNGELDLLCVTTSAGGVGLTLTRAHSMVMLSRPFAFWMADQMEDRIHRRGQDAAKITIIDIVARDTVESKIRAILKEKAQSLSELLREKKIVESFLGGQAVKV